MNRDFSRLNIYLNRLMGDIYPQPPDAGHTQWAQLLTDRWLSHVQCNSVLDAGCGQAFMQGMIEMVGKKYTGVTLGEDFSIAKAQGKNVVEADFTFLPFEDKSFDMVLARHSLEHSPMPIITLMEWHRVASQFLCLVAPIPEGWGWVGRNHYSVANEEQLLYWLECAGWKRIWGERVVIREEDDKKKVNMRPIEYWFLCEKVKQ